MSALEPADRPDMVPGPDGPNSRQEPSGRAGGASEPDRRPGWRRWPAEVRRALLDQDADYGEDWLIDVGTFRTVVDVDTRGFL